MVKRRYRPRPMPKKTIRKKNPVQRTLDHRIPPKANKEALKENYDIISSSNEDSTSEIAGTSLSLRNRKCKTSEKVLPLKKVKSLTEEHFARTSGVSESISCSSSNKNSKNNELEVDKFSFDEKSVGNNKPNNLSTPFTPKKKYSVAALASQNSKKIEDMSQIPGMDFIICIKNERKNDAGQPNLYDCVLCHHKPIKLSAKEIVLHSKTSEHLTRMKEYKTGKGQINFATSASYLKVREIVNQKIITLRKQKCEIKKIMFSVEESSSLDTQDALKNTSKDIDIPESKQQSKKFKEIVFDVEDSSIPNRQNVLKNTSKDIDIPESKQQSKKFKKIVFDVEESSSLNMQGGLKNTSKTIGLPKSKQQSKKFKKIVFDVEESCSLNTRDASKNTSNDIDIIESKQKSKRFKEIVFDVEESSSVNTRDALRNTSKAIDLPKSKQQSKKFKKKKKLKPRLWDIPRPIVEKSVPEMIYKYNEVVIVANHQYKQYLEDIRGSRHSRVCVMADDDISIEELGKYIKTKAQHMPLNTLWILVTGMGFLYERSIHQECLSLKCYNPVISVKPTDNISTPLNTKKTNKELNYVLRRIKSDVYHNAIPPESDFFVFVPIPLSFILDSYQAHNDLHTLYESHPHSLIAEYGDISCVNKALQDIIYSFANVTLQSLKRFGISTQYVMQFVSHKNQAATITDQIPDSSHRLQEWIKILKKTVFLALKILTPNLKKLEPDFDDERFIFHSLNDSKGHRRVFYELAEEVTNLSSPFKDKERQCFHNQSTSKDKPNLKTTSYTVAKQYKKMAGDCEKNGNRNSQPSTSQSIMAEPLHMNVRHKETPKLTRHLRKKTNEELEQEAWETETETLDTEFPKWRGHLYKKTSEELEEDDWETETETFETDFPKWKSPLYKKTNYELEQDEAWELAARESYNRVTPKYTSPLYKKTNYELEQDEAWELAARESYDRVTPKYTSPLYKKTSAELEQDGWELVQTEALDRDFPKWRSHLNKKTSGELEQEARGILEIEAFDRKPPKWTSPLYKKTSEELEQEAWDIAETEAFDREIPKWTSRLYKKTSDELEQEAWELAATDSDDRVSITTDNQMPTSLKLWNIKENDAFDYLQYNRAKHFAERKHSKLNSSPKMSKSLHKKVKSSHVANSLAKQTVKASTGSDLSTIERTVKKSITGPCSNQSLSSVDHHNPKSGQNLNISRRTVKKSVTEACIRPNQSLSSVDDHKPKPGQNLKTCERTVKKSVTEACSNQSLGSINHHNPKPSQNLKTCERTLKKSVTEDCSNQSLGSINPHNPKPSQNLKTSESTCKQFDTEANVSSNKSTNLSIDNFIAKQRMEVTVIDLCTDECAMNSTNKLDSSNQSINSLVDHLNSKRTIEDSPSVDLRTSESTSKKSDTEICSKQSVNPSVKLISKQTMGAGTRIDSSALEGIIQESNSTTYDSIILIHYGYSMKFEHKGIYKKISKSWMVNASSSKGELAELIVSLDSKASYLFIISADISLISTRKNTMCNVNICNPPVTYLTLESITGSVLKESLQILRNFTKSLQSTAPASKFITVPLYPVKCICYPISTSLEKCVGLHSWLHEVSSRTQYFVDMNKDAWYQAIFLLREKWNIFSLVYHCDDNLSNAADLLHKKYIPAIDWLDATNLDKEKVYQRQWESELISILNSVALSRKDLSHKKVNQEIHTPPVVCLSSQEKLSMPEKKISNHSESKTLSPVAAERYTSELHSISKSLESETKSTRVESCSSRDGTRQMSLNDFSQGSSSSFNSTSRNRNSNEGTLDSLKTVDINISSKSRPGKSNHNYNAIICIHYGYEVDKIIDLSTITKNFVLWQVDLSITERELEDKFTSLNPQLSYLILVSSDISLISEKMGYLQCQLEFCPIPISYLSLGLSSDSIFRRFQYLQNLTQKILLFVPNSRVVLLPTLPRKCLSYPMGSIPNMQQESRSVHQWLHKLSTANQYYILDGGMNAWCQVQCLLREKWYTFSLGYLETDYLSARVHAFYKNNYPEIEWVNSASSAFVSNDQIKWNTKMASVLKQFCEKSVSSQNEMVKQCLPELPKCQEISSPQVLKEPDITGQESNKELLKTEEHQTYSGKVTEIENIYEVLESQSHELTEEELQLSEELERELLEQEETEDLEREIYEDDSENEDNVESVEQCTVNELSTEPIPISSQINDSTDSKNEEMVNTVDISEDSPLKVDDSEASKQLCDEDTADKSCPDNSDESFNEEVISKSYKVADTPFHKISDSALKVDDSEVPEQSCDEDVTDKSCHDNVDEYFDEVISKSCKVADKPCHKIPVSPLEIDDNKVSEQSCDEDVTDKSCQENVDESHDEVIIVSCKVPDKPYHKVAGSPSQIDYIEVSEQSCDENVTDKSCQDNVESFNEEVINEFYKVTDKPCHKEVDSSSKLDDSKVSKPSYHEDITDESCKVTDKPYHEVFGSPSEVNDREVSKYSFDEDITDETCDDNIIDESCHEVTDEVNHELVISESCHEVTDESNHELMISESCHEVTDEPNHELMISESCHEVTDESNHELVISESCQKRMIAESCDEVTNETYCKVVAVSEYCQDDESYNLDDESVDLEREIFEYDSENEDNLESTQQCTDNELSTELILISPSQVNDSTDSKNKEMANTIDIFGNTSSKVDDSEVSKQLCYEEVISKSCEVADKPCHKIGDSPLEVDDNEVFEKPCDEDTFNESYEMTDESCQGVDTESSHKVADGSSYKEMAIESCHGMANGLCQEISDKNKIFDESCQKVADESCHEMTDESGDKAAYESSEVTDKSCHRIDSELHHNKITDESYKKLADESCNESDKSAPEVACDTSLKQTSDELHEEKFDKSPEIVNDPCNKHTEYEPKPEDVADESCHKEMVIESCHEKISTDIPSEKIPSVLPTESYDSSQATAPIDKELKPVDKASKDTINIEDKIISKDAVNRIVGGDESQEDLSPTEMSTNSSHVFELKESAEDASVTVNLNLVSQLNENEISEMDVICHASSDTNKSETENMESLSVVNIETQDTENEKSIIEEEVMSEDFQHQNEMENHQKIGKTQGEAVNILSDVSKSEKHELPNISQKESQLSSYDSYDNYQMLNSEHEETAQIDRGPKELKKIENSKCLNLSEESVVDKGNVLQRGTFLYQLAQDMHENDEKEGNDTSEIQISSSVTQNNDGERDVCEISASVTLNKDEKNEVTDGQKSSSTQNQANNEDKNNVNDLQKSTVTQISVDDENNVSGMQKSPSATKNKDDQYYGDAGKCIVASSISSSKVICEDTAESNEQRITTDKPLYEEHVDVDSQFNHGSLHETLADAFIQPTSIKLLPESISDDTDKGEFILSKSSNVSESSVVPSQSFETSENQSKGYILPDEKDGNSFISYKMQEPQDAPKVWKPSDGTYDCAIDQSVSSSREGSYISTDNMFTEYQADEHCDKEGDSSGLEYMSNEYTPFSESDGDHITSHERNQTRRFSPEISKHESDKQTSFNFSSTTYASCDSKSTFESVINKNEYPIMDESLELAKLQTKMTSEIQPMISLNTNSGAKIDIVLMLENNEDNNDCNELLIIRENKFMSADSPLHFKVNDDNDTENEDTSLSPQSLENRGFNPLGQSKENEDITVSQSTEIKIHLSPLYIQEKSTSSSSSQLLNNEADNLLPESLDNEESTITDNIKLSQSGENYTSNQHQFRENDILPQSSGNEVANLHQSMESLSFLAMGNEATKSSVKLMENESIKSLSELKINEPTKSSSKPIEDKSTKSLSQFHEDEATKSSSKSIEDESTKSLSQFQEDEATKSLSQPHEDEATKSSSKSEDKNTKLISQPIENESTKSSKSVDKSINLSPQISENDYNVKSNEHKSKSQTLTTNESSQQQLMENETTYPLPENYNVSSQYTDSDISSQLSKNIEESPSFLSIEREETIQSDPIPKKIDPINLCSQFLENEDTSSVSQVMNSEEINSFSHLLQKQSTNVCPSLKNEGLGSDNSPPLQHVENDDTKTISHRENENIPSPQYLGDKDSIPSHQCLGDKGASLLPKNGNEDTNSSPVIPQSIRNGAANQLHDVRSIEKTSSSSHVVVDETSPSLHSVENEATNQISQSVGIDSVKHLYDSVNNKEFNLSESVENKTSDQPQPRDIEDIGPSMHLYNSLNNKNSNLSGLIENKTSDQPQSRDSEDTGPSIHSLENETTIVLQSIRNDVTSTPHQLMNSRDKSQSPQSLENELHIQHMSKENKNEKSSESLANQFTNPVSQSTESSNPVLSMENENIHMSHLLDNDGNNLPTQAQALGNEPNLELSDTSSKILSDKDLSISASPVVGDKTGKDCDVFSDVLEEIHEKAPPGEESLGKTSELSDTSSKILSDKDLPISASPVVGDETGKDRDVFSDVLEEVREKAAPGKESLGETSEQNIETDSSQHSKVDSKGPSICNDNEIQEVEIEPHPDPELIILSDSDYENETCSKSPSELSKEMAPHPTNEVAMLVEGYINRGEDKRCLSTKDLNTLFLKKKFYDHIYIIGNDNPVSEELRKIIDYTYIETDVSTFNESSVDEILKQIKLLKSNSICVVICQFSFLTKVLPVSKECIRYSCTHPLVLQTYKNYPQEVLEETKNFISKQISNIKSTLSDLSKDIPVLVMPVKPTLLYIDVCATHLKHIQHHTLSKEAMLVLGLPYKWMSTVQHLLTEWSELMTQNYNHLNPEVASKWEQKQQIMFPINNYEKSFLLQWKEPLKWKNTITDVLLLLNVIGIQHIIGTKVSDSNQQRIGEVTCHRSKAASVSPDAAVDADPSSCKSISKSHDSYEVEILCESDCIPEKFFEEFIHILEDESEIQKKQGCFEVTLKNFQKVLLLSYQLHLLVIGDACLHVALKDKDYLESDLNKFNKINCREKTYNGVLTTVDLNLLKENFDAVYDKWKFRILKNVKTKWTRALCAASYKTILCPQNCIEPMNCVYYHSDADRRRNPLVFEYGSGVKRLCINSKQKNKLKYLGIRRTCTEGLDCPRFHNVFEQDFHPPNLYVTRCAASKTRMTCFEKSPLCIRSHRDTPEMLFSKKWVDLLLFGPSNAFMFLVGTIRRFYRSDDRVKGVKIIFISAECEFLRFMKNVVADICNVHGLVYGSLSDLGLQYESATLVMDTPMNVANFGKFQGQLLSNTCTVVIVSQIDEILANPNQKKALAAFWSEFKMIYLPNSNKSIQKVFVANSYDENLAKEIITSYGIVLEVVKESRLMPILDDDIPLSKEEEGTVPLVRNLERKEAGAAGVSWFRKDSSGANPSERRRSPSPAKGTRSSGRHLKRPYSRSPDKTSSKRCKRTRTPSLGKSDRCGRGKSPHKGKNQAPTSLPPISLNSECSRSPAPLSPTGRHPQPPPRNQPALSPGNQVPTPTRRYPPSPPRGGKSPKRKQPSLPPLNIPFPPPPPLLILPPPPPPPWGHVFDWGERSKRSRGVVSPSGDPPGEEPPEKRRFTPRVGEEFPSTSGQCKEKPYDDVSLRMELGGTLYEEYCNREHSLNRAVNTAFKVFWTMPDLHPENEEVYGTFMAMYSAKYQNHSDSHKEEKWMEYWRSKFHDIRQGELNKQILKLLKEFRLNVGDNPSAASTTTTTTASTTATTTTSHKNVSPSWEAQSAGKPRERSPLQAKDYERRTSHDDSYPPAAVKEYPQGSHEGAGRRDDVSRQQSTSTSASNVYTKAGESSQRSSRIQELYPTLSHGGNESSRYFEEANVGRASNSHPEMSRRGRDVTATRESSPVISSKETISLTESTAYISTKDYEIAENKGKADESSFSVGKTLAMLMTIVPELGHLGASLKSIVETAKERGTTTPQALKIFTDKQNILLIDLAVKSLQSPRKEVVQAMTNALIKHAEEAEETKQQDINIEAIACATVGKNSGYVLDLIKTALALEGKETSKERINQLFISVCERHFEMAENLQIHLQDNQQVKWHNIQSD